MVRPKPLLFVSFILSIVTLSLLSGGNAFASDARNFNAGKIIDDAVFTNADSMNVQQIQSFLNSKTACDTYGRKQSELGGGTRAQWLAAHGISTPITCLRDYYENPSNSENNYGKAIPTGAISSAQIIYNYAHQFNINPQVLIVTLQKENGLVTDEWPTPKQYSEAMGFGCPDNVAPGAPACDPAYKSFSTQIYQAARHFRNFINNTPGWWIPFTTGNNSVRWSPNAACGSSIVNIQNRSTVALYSYTPYQPNQAAKNAQYGTGDACSAYGNRNFYLYFTDWFGITIGTQDLITDGVSGIYYISNGYKYYVPTMEVYYNLGYTDADISRIIRTSAFELNLIPTKSGFSQASVVVSSQNQGIFVVSNGYKYYVPSMNVLYDYGFSDSDIMPLSEESINRYSTASKNLSNFASDGNGYAYRIEGGTRRVIFQPWVLSEYPDASTSNQLSWTVLDKVTIGAPITKGRLALVSGNTTYVAVNGKWFTVRDQDVASCIGVEGIVTIEPYRTVAATSSGTIDSCFVKDQSNAKFLMDGSVKYAIDSNDEIQYSTINTSDNIANMTNVAYTAHKNIFATNNGIFKLQNGTVRHIMSMEYVQEATGGTNVRVLNTDSLRGLTGGANVYATGSLVAGATRGINLVVDDKVSYIGSMDQFYAYGFNVGNIGAIGDAEINRQTRGDDLPGTRVKCGGSNYVLSDGTKYIVSSPLITAFGGSVAFKDISCPAIDGMRSATMTRFVTSPNNKNIYYIDNGNQRHILAWQTFLSLGGTVNDVITLSRYVLDSFPVGSDI